MWIPTKTNPPNDLINEIIIGIPEITQHSR